METGEREHGNIIKEDDERIGVTGVTTANAFTKDEWLVVNQDEGIIEYI